MTSMGEVWLATQIPPFLGLFSLEELGQEANYVVHCKNDMKSILPTAILKTFF